MDNETYWTRVASHMVWRRSDVMEADRHMDNYLQKEGYFMLPRIKENIYDMITLDNGYYWGMERFFQRLEEVIDYDSIKGRDQDPAWWKQLKSMTLKERTQKLMKDGLNTYYGLYAYSVKSQKMSMKQLAKSIFKKSLYFDHGVDSIDIVKLYNKFLCDLDDDPRMHPKHKRIILEKIEEIGIPGFIPRI